MRISELIKMLKWARKEVDDDAEVYMQIIDDRCEYVEIFKEVVDTVSVDGTVTLKRQTGVNNG